MNREHIISRPGMSLLATHQVLRNTYLLLALTFLFSAATAAFAMVTHAAPVGFLITLLGYFGLLYLTVFLRNSPWGLASIFAFTGFLGYTLGPILTMYLSTYSNGSQLIMTALGGTGVIFLALSAYVMTTQRDFSYMGGFLMAAGLTAFLLGIGAIVFNVPGLYLAISAVWILVSSGYILFETSQIIHGGEQNYIMATINLYVSLFNLFVNLLQLLGAFSGRRD